MLVRVALGVLAVLAAAMSAQAEQRLRVDVPAVGLFVDDDAENPSGVLIDAMRAALDAADIDAAFAAIPLPRLLRHGAADPWSCAGPVPMWMVDGRDLTFTALLAHIRVYAMALADAPIDRIDALSDLRFYRSISPRGTPAFDQFDREGLQLLGVADLDRGVDALLRGRADLLIAPELAGEVAAHERGVALVRALQIDADDVAIACNAAMPAARRDAIAQAFAEGIVGAATAPIWRAVGLEAERLEALAALEAARARLNSGR